MNKDKFRSTTDDICLFLTPEEYVLFVHNIDDCSPTCESNDNGMHNADCIRTTRQTEVHR